VQVDAVQTFPLTESTSDMKWHRQNSLATYSRSC